MGLAMVVGEANGPSADLLGHPFVDLLANVVDGEVAHLPRVLQELVSLTLS